MLIIKRIDRFILRKFFLVFAASFFVCLFIFVMQFTWVHIDALIGKLEADIIAYKDNLIVFIEVKTRTTDYYGDPEDFVDRKKQKAYIRLANAYILRDNRTEEARFDIISIIIGSPESEPQVKHIVNAFTTIG